MMGTLWGAPCRILTGSSRSGHQWPSHSRSCSSSRPWQVYPYAEGTRQTAQRGAINVRPGVCGALTVDKQLANAAVQPAGRGAHTRILDRRFPQLLTKWWSEIVVYSVSRPLEDFCRGVLIFCGIDQKYNLCVCVKFYVLDKITITVEVWNLM